MNKVEEFIKRYERIHTGEEPVLIKTPEINNGQITSYFSNPVNYVFPGEQGLKYFTGPLQKVAKIKGRAITVLDYGCGQAMHMYRKSPNLKDKTFFEYHKDKVQCCYLYDPCVPKFSTKPAHGTTFDVTLCGDVMEHVPEEGIDQTLKEISSYTKQDGVVMFSISSSLAVKMFKDGTNLHVTIKSYDWWVDTLARNVTQTFLLAFKANDNQGRTRVRNTSHFTL